MSASPTKRSLLVPGMALLTFALLVNGVAFLRGTGGSAGSFVIRVQTMDLPPSADPTTHARPFPALLVYPSLPELAERTETPDRGKTWRFLLPASVDAVHALRSLERGAKAGDGTRPWEKLEARSGMLLLTLIRPSGHLPPAWLGEPRFRVPGPADFDPATGEWKNRRKGTSSTRFRLAGIKKGTWLLVEREPRNPKIPIEIVLLMGPAPFPSSDFIERAPPSAPPPTVMHAWDDARGAWVKKGAMETLRFTARGGVFQEGLLGIEARK